ncbi:GxxExxY protein [Fluviicola taffensis]|uniref:GxxExxY protein n=1 Tax=Fluviicola taffensis TaxID=191579 RepID=UPI003137ACC3
MRTTVGAENFPPRLFYMMINYLAVSGMEVGLLINFRKPKLQYKRIILSER